MRTDARRNLKKVATEVMKDPLASRDKIAERTGLSQGNVSDKLTKLDGRLDRTATVIAIEETDLEIVTLAQSINLERLRDEEERKKIKAMDVAQIAKISQERYSKFAGANTDNEGGEIQVINYADIE